MFYDCEEIDYDAQRADPDPGRAAATGSRADLAMLGEPTNGQVEAGCQGTAAVA